MRKWATSPKQVSNMGPLIPLSEEDEETQKIKNRLLLKRQVIKLSIQTGSGDNEKTNTDSTRKSTNQSQDQNSPAITELEMMPYLKQVISNRETWKISETHSDSSSTYKQKASKPSLVKVQSQFNRMHEDLLVSSDESQEESKDIRQSAKLLNLQQSNVSDKGGSQVQMTQEQEDNELIDELCLSNSENSISQGQSEESLESPAVQRRSEVIKNNNKAILTSGSQRMLRRSSSFTMLLDEKNGASSPTRKKYSKDHKMEGLLQDTPPEELFQLLVNMAQVN